MAMYEIPLKGSPKSFSADLPSGFYNFRTVYVAAPNGEGGWVLDIADKNFVALVCGIPLVTGTNLLGQYAYLGIATGMYVKSDDSPTDVPTFANLGTTSHLYLEA